MRRLTLALPGNEELAHSLAQACGSEVGGIEIRRFPDGESYVRLHGDPLGRPVDLVCTLARPDPQFLSLVFAADAARELGASEVNLVAPYLAYMRQDKRFQEGESVTSLSFARLVSSTFDKLLTVDPHLHRHPTLSAVYTIPTKALHAAPLLADWIVQHVEKPSVVVDGNGKTLSDLPKANKSDDAAKAKEADTIWKTLKKDAKAIAQNQIVRLELAMCAQRRWEGDSFRALFLEHPLLIHLVRRPLGSTSRRAP